MFKHKPDGRSREVPLVPSGQTTHHHNDCFFFSFFPLMFTFKQKVVIAQSVTELFCVLCQNK